MDVQDLGSIGSRSEYEREEGGDGGDGEEQDDLPVVAEEKLPAGDATIRPPEEDKAVLRADDKNAIPLQRVGIDAKQAKALTAEMAKEVEKKTKKTAIPQHTNSTASGVSQQKTRLNGILTTVGEQLTNGDDSVSSTITQVMLHQQQASERDRERERDIEERRYQQEIRREDERVRREEERRHRDEERDRKRDEDREERRQADLARAERAESKHMEFLALLFKK